MINRLLRERERENGEVEDLNANKTTLVENSQNTIWTVIYQVESGQKFLGSMRFIWRDKYYMQPGLELG